MSLLKIFSQSFKLIIYTDIFANLNINLRVSHQLQSTHCTFPIVGRHLHHRLHFLRPQPLPFFPVIFPHLQMKSQQFCPDPQHLGPLVLNNRCVWYSQKQGLKQKSRARKVAVKYLSIINVMSLSVPNIQKEICIVELDVQPVVVVWKSQRNLQSRIRYQHKTTHEIDLQFKITYLLYHSNHRNGIKHCISHRTLVVKLSI